MTRDLAWLLALAGLLGCPPTSEDTTTSPTTTTSGPTTADTTTGTTAASTMTSTTATTGAVTQADESHGLTLSEEGPTGEDCEMFDFSEVAGCQEPVGQQLCSEGSAHFRIGTELSWEANPPHSGSHWPMWATWEEHESTLEREYWIHNLEHGGIVLSYRCPGGCEPELDVLRSVMQMRPELRILITPDPELPADGFAAISWTWVHRFDTPDLDTLLCFVDQHENHAPEDVP